MNSRLTEKLAELASIKAAAVANFERPIGGRGKQGKIRTDAAVRRAARLVEQQRRLQREIMSLGGALPASPPVSEPQPVVAHTTCTPAPAPSALADDQLRAADAQMDEARRASGARSLTDEHRAVKAELGRRWNERTTKAVRSAAGQKAAATRARRRAAGLPPKRQSFPLDNAPAGGWTDADRVR